MFHRAAAAAALVVVLVLVVPAAGGSVAWGSSVERHVVRALWVADAVCETGRRPPAWYTRAGVYEGGIRFYRGTWVAWRRYVPAARRFAHADQAPAWVQAAVAEEGLRRHGRWGCLYHADVWELR